MKSSQRKSKGERVYCLRRTKARVAPRNLGAFNNISITALRVTKRVGDTV